MALTPIKQHLDVIDIKKAVPDGANIENGNEKTISFEPENNLSKTNSNTLRTSVQVAYFLLHGAENAISSKDLIKITGIPTDRVLRTVVGRERDAGAVILSTIRNRGGYFLPDIGEKGLKETEVWIRTQKSRAANILRSLKSAQRSISTPDGQLELREERHECGEK